MLAQAPRPRKAQGASERTLHHRERPRHRAAGSRGPRRDADPHPSTPTGSGFAKRGRRRRRLRAPPKAGSGSIRSKSYGARQSAERRVDDFRRTLEAGLLHPGGPPWPRRRPPSRGVARGEAWKNRCLSERAVEAAGKAGIPASIRGVGVSPAGTQDEERRGLRRPLRARATMSARGGDHLDA